MKHIAIGFTLAAVIASAPVVHAAVIDISARSLPTTSYLPDSVQVADGDTVRWTRSGGDHTVTSGTGVDDPQAGTLFNANLTISAPTFLYQFNTPGIYNYFCIQHGSAEEGGMTGQVVVTGPVQEYISTMALLFTEDSVKIAPGETVEFYNGIGEHTVTNGTGLSDPNAGTTFDSPLGTTFPAIQITFNTAGVYPFFCIPHEVNSMFATVYVVEPIVCACDCHTDPACDGFTTILDVVEAVNAAFRNDPAAPDPNPSCPRETTDTDCNGFTDILDVSHTVNVAFRNASPATEFCNPCP